MNKFRFYWKKFVENEYNYSHTQLMEVISFIVHKGKHIDKRFGQYSREGTSKAMFRYGQNNDPLYFAELKLTEADELDYKLLNFICRKQMSEIEQLKIQLRFDKPSSFLEVPKACDIEQLICLSNFNNAKLNFNPHAEFRQDLHSAYIKSVKIKLGTFLRVEYDYTFDMNGLKGSYWTHYFDRNDGESTTEYLTRINQYTFNFAICNRSFYDIVNKFSKMKICKLDII